MRGLGKFLLALAVLGSLCSVVGQNAQANSAHRFEENRGRGFIEREDAIFITRLFYRAFLFRGPDHEGLQHHVRFIMQHGEEGLFITARNFMLSPEYQQNIQGRIAPREVVRNIYRVLFRRVPDAEGHQYWSQMLRQGQTGAVAEGIVRSEEFRQLYLY